ncbi:MAG: STAS domain-containing protein [Polaromonas sp.]
MELKTEKLQGGILIVHVQVDRINACNAQDFQHALMSLMDQRYQVVLDVQSVRFVDGCGFGALLACLRMINNRCGELALCSLSASLVSLFALMRMHRVFNVYSSCDEAVCAFS